MNACFKKIVSIGWSNKALIIATNSLTNNTRNQKLRTCRPVKYMENKIEK